MSGKRDFDQNSPYGLKPLPSGRGAIHPAIEQFHFEIVLASALADARHGGASAIYLRGQRRSERTGWAVARYNLKVPLLQKPGGVIRRMEPDVD
jgi:hypothetical protein